MQLPQDLVYEFLETFARCEYALKAAGFAKNRNAASHDVESDWNRFAKEVETDLAATGDEEFKNAVDFLLTEPPRKQVFDNANVVWKNSPPSPTSSQAANVLVMVRRVRNNLFHGAKVWSSEYGDRERDEKLIRASLVVLQRCMQIRENVQQAFKVGTF